VQKTQASRGLGGEGRKVILRQIKRDRQTAHQRLRRDPKCREIGRHDGPNPRHACRGNGLGANAGIVIGEISARLEQIGT
jgi:hypothetical protein